MQISKGCPRGSLFGPLAYNIFSNDLLLLIKDHCDISNYADDTTASCAGDNVDEIIEKLQNVASIMLTWFQSNYLQANPDKFQFILYNSDDKYMLTINKNVKLESLDYVKLLGVTVDTKLTFTRHVDELRSKAGKKINMLRRLSNVLTMEAKCLLFQSFIFYHTLIFAQLSGIIAV